MCMICERIRMIQKGTNPYFVQELNTGYVVLGDHQHFRGYTLFLYKQHVTELFHLPRAVKLQFLEEMSLVAQAAAAAFGAEKMNYELLGNGDTHLHWHLFPRVAGDLEGYGNQGKGPVWWYPAQKMYSDAARPAAAELEHSSASRTAPPAVRKHAGLPGPRRACADMPQAMAAGEKRKQGVIKAPRGERICGTC